MKGINLINKENKNQLEKGNMEEVFHYLQNKITLKINKIKFINNNIYIGNLSSFNVIRIEYKDGYLIELLKVWDLDNFKVNNKDISFLIENKFDFELSEKGYYLKRTVDNKEDLLELLNGPINQILNTLGLYKKKD